MILREGPRKKRFEGFPCEPARGERLSNCLSTGILGGKKEKKKKRRFSLKGNKKKGGGSKKRWAKTFTGTGKNNRGKGSGQARNLGATAPLEKKRPNRGAGFKVQTAKALKKKVEMGGRAPHGVRQ